MPHSGQSAEKDGIHYLASLQSESNARSMIKTTPQADISAGGVSLLMSLLTSLYLTLTILGYDVDGKKNVLGLWLNKTEGKHHWMQILDELNERDVEDVLYLCMERVSGLEEGARSIFPKVTVQRCIVHLIRNFMKCIPSRDYKAFTAQLKRVYGASSLTAVRSEFECFKKAWSKYPSAVDVWVRKVMYTHQRLESVNSSFRIVTKKGVFPDENALLKLLFL